MSVLVDVHLMNNGCIYQLSCIESAISLMTPGFPETIKIGDSSSVTVQFRCDVTQQIYADVMDLGPRDWSDSQYIDLRDHHVTGLMMKLNGREKNLPRS